MQIIRYLKPTYSLNKSINIYETTSEIIIDRCNKNIINIRAPVIAFYNVTPMEM
jgi:hypothetical protein